MASFEPEQITGPLRVQRHGNFTADFYFAVALREGAEGHVVVGTGDVTEGPKDGAARFERVAAALNFVVEGILGDGVASNARHDPQAKALGEWLRSRVVDVPEALL